MDTLDTVLQLARCSSEPANLTSQHFKKITTGEIGTSSISCAQKYFQDERTSKEKLVFFWANGAARYGRIEVMEWAHQQGYSAAWEQKHDWQGSNGPHTCQKAAEFGQLQALQWLRKKGCDWNKYTNYYRAAENGHLSTWTRIFVTLLL